LEEEILRISAANDPESCFQFHHPHKKAASNDRTSLSTAAAAAAIMPFSICAFLMASSSAGAALNKSATSASSVTDCL
jgi:hypothetical protein